MKANLSYIFWYTVPVLGSVAFFYFVCINPPPFLETLMKLCGGLIIVAGAISFITATVRDWFRKCIKKIVKEVGDAKD